MGSSQKEFPNPPRNGIPSIAMDKIKMKTSLRKLDMQAVTVATLVIFLFLAFFLPAFQFQAGKIIPNGDRAAVKQKRDSSSQGGFSQEKALFTISESSIITTYVAGRFYLGYSRRSLEKVIKTDCRPFSDKLANNTRVALQKPFRFFDMSYLLRFCHKETRGDESDPA